MKLVELLLQTLAEVSGMKSDEVAALVKTADGAIDETASKVNVAEVKAAVSKKITDAKAEVQTLTDAQKTEQFEEGRKKGKRQGAEQVEKLLATTFAVDGEGKEGEALVKHVHSKVTAGAKKGELTQQDVESSPHFTAAVARARQAAEAERDTAKREFDTYKRGIERVKTLDDAWKVGEGIIKELNLNLSTDPERRAQQMAIIRAQVETERNFRKEADGSVSVLKMDGTPDKDPLSNLVLYKDLVSQTATRLFDVSKGEKRTAPNVEGGDGGKGGGGTSEGKWTKGLPKSNDEYLKLATDPNIPIAERIDLQTQWDAQQASSDGAGQ